MAIGGSAADLTHALKGIDFPCNKKSLVDHARKNHADKEALDGLSKLPDQQFQNMAEVMKAFGQEKH